MKMTPGARWTLPRAKAGTNRSLYFFRGSALTVAGKPIPAYSGIFLRGDRDVEIENGPDETELLLLQGRPIKEPVAAHGPFVMNTRAEIQQAFSDYQRTRFGGWPWKSEAPVHAREDGKFAKRPDGSTERGE
jgi:redox-sensitive bicupin YhaK (pirin superfamily)